MFREDGKGAIVFHFNGVYQAARYPTGLHKELRHILGSRPMPPAQAHIDPDKTAACFVAVRGAPTEMPVFSVIRAEV